MEKEDGGSAFPAIEKDNSEILQVSSGMSFRDYCAIHASDEDIKQLQSLKPEGYISTQCARYWHADLMIEARNK